MRDVIGLMGHEHPALRPPGRSWEKRADSGGKHTDRTGKRRSNKDVVVKVQIRVKDSCVRLRLAKPLVADSLPVSSGLKGIHGYGLILIKPQAGPCPKARFKKVDQATSCTSLKFEARVPA